MDSMPAVPCAGIYAIIGAAWGIGGSGGKGLAC